MRNPGSVWKWLGLAGVAGVAATGVVIARNERRRRRLSPDQVRARLHRRLAELDHGGTDSVRTRPGVPAPDAAPLVPVKRRGRRR